MDEVIFKDVLLREHLQDRPHTVNKQHHIPRIAGKIYKTPLKFGTNHAL
jgi:hypothetical protein